MDKFQERELHQLLNGMMPADYKFPELWKYTVDNVVSLSDWERFAAHPQDEAERQMFLGFIERYSKRLIEDIGEAHMNVMLAEVRRFRIQCMEYYPNSETATVEHIPFTVVKDYDGYLVEETKSRTVYHLLKPWRGFKPGQVIEHHAAEWGVGGPIGSHWGIYYPPTQEEEDEEDEAEEVITTVSSQPKKKTVNSDEPFEW